MDRRASQRERELASRLLAIEAGHETDLRRRVEALARALDKLYRALVGIVGPAGNLALAERALHLAAQECPCLGSVRSRLQDHVLTFEGLQESMLGTRGPDVNQASTALLGNFLWLISSLLGLDLTLRLIKVAWPMVDENDWSSGSSEDDV